MINSKYSWIADRIETATRRTRRWTQLWESWIDAEPTLADWPITRILDVQSDLPDEPLRALVGVARSEAVRADTAVVVILYTRIPQLMRWDARYGDDEGHHVSHLTEMILEYSFSNTYPIAPQLNARQAYVRKHQPWLRRVTPQPQFTPLDPGYVEALQRQLVETSGVVDRRIDQNDDELRELWTGQILSQLADRHYWRPTDKTFPDNAAKARAFVELMVSIENLPTRNQVVEAGLPASCHRALTEAARAGLLAKV